MLRTESVSALALPEPTTLTAPALMLVLGRRRRVAQRVDQAIAGHDALALVEVRRQADDLERAVQVAARRHAVERDRQLLARAGRERERLFADGDPTQRPAPVRGRDAARGLRPRARLGRHVQRDLGLVQTKTRRHRPGPCDRPSQLVRLCRRAEREPTVPGVRRARGLLVRLRVGDHRAAPGERQRPHDHGRPANRSRHHPLHSQTPRCSRTSPDLPRHNPPATQKERNFRSDDPGGAEISRRSV